jgi:NadR type nicotinamide-nucleotide adenylyltransferase
MNRILKIAITGPESTGKSILAEQLAGHYHTAWVTEYAREYLDRLKRSYIQEDILQIAKGQLRDEKKMEGVAKELLFCDTELIVTKIWSEVKYKTCDPWILKMIENHLYDLYLLCNIDLPWEEDPLREHPHMRETLFNLYFDELMERQFPFDVISGIGEERLKNAIQSVERMINK